MRGAEMKRCFSVLSGILFIASSLSSCSSYPSIGVGYPNRELLTYGFSTCEGETLKEMSLYQSMEKDPSQLLWKITAKDTGKKIVLGTFGIVPDGYIGEGIFPSLEEMKDHSYIFSAKTNKLRSYLHEFKLSELPVDGSYRFKNKVSNSTSTAEQLQKQASLPCRN
jgi:hypothetical protein